jgi:UDP-N-acetylglucosamine:LPS N-acetylglucosamine transferase
VQKLHHFAEPTILVRGLPENTAPIESLPPTIVQYNHVSAKELNQLILRSKWVIARAGYSTIMDVCALQKKAIIIPTPGQTEQEYLAAYLHDAKRFYSLSQNEFQLTKDLKELLAF